MLCTGNPYQKKRRKEKESNMQYSSIFFMSIFYSNKKGLVGKNKLNSKILMFSGKHSY